MQLDPRIAALIVGAAQKYGQDPAYLQRQAEVESGGNPNAQNPRSSAGGLFQFTDGTAKQYGLANKFDPDASADAAARLARDNGAFLSNRLGRDPTSGELYLAHQQGAGGAAKLLANPDARAVDLVGSKAVTGNGGSPDMTAAQFATRWTGKFDDVRPTGPTMTMPGEAPAASGAFGLAGIEASNAPAPVMTMPAAAPAKDDGFDVAGILKTLMGNGAAPGQTAAAPAPLQPRSILPDPAPRAMPFDLSSFLGRLAAR